MLRHMSRKKADDPVPVSLSTPTDHSHLAINLRVLSKLKAEDKLSRVGPYLVIDGHTPYWTPLLRYLRSDNRLQMILELEELYREAIEIISKAAPGDAWSEMISRLVGQSLHGVTVLRQTYHADATMVARLEHVLEIARKHVPALQQGACGETRSF